MIGSIFRGCLHNNTRVTIYWSLAISFFGFYAVAIAPDNAGVQQYATLLDSFGPVSTVMGVSQGVLSSSRSFVTFIYLDYTFLYFSFFALISAISVFAGEEEHGILDWQLSLPVPRIRFLWERSFAFLIIFAIVSLSSGVVTWASAFLNDNVSLEFFAILSGSLNFLPTLMLVYAITLLISVLVRRRNTAIMLAGIFVVVSYFFNGMGELAGGSIGDFMRQISYFYHYQRGNVLIEGLNPANILSISAVAVLSLILTSFAFQRRDIGI